MSAILGTVASSILKQTTAYNSIATYTAAGGESSFTFTSIPQTYAHLEVRILSRRPSGSSHVIALQMNSDTGANYSWHNAYSNGSLAFAGAASASTYIDTFWPNTGSNLSNQFGAGTIDILDYSSSTKNTTVRSLGGGDHNGSGSIYLTSGAWYNTAAITSLTIFFRGDTVVAGSSFALYGIKGV
jgi:hypothetical protein